MWSKPSHRRAIARDVGVLGARQQRNPPRAELPRHHGPSQAFWPAGRKDPPANVFKLVHDWLRDEKHGEWLLVLDIADSAAILSLPSDGRKTWVDNGEGALGRRLSR